MRPAYLDIIGDLIACGFDPQITKLRAAVISDTIPADIDPPVQCPE